MKKLAGAEGHLDLLRSIEGELRKLGDDYSVPLVARQPEGFPRPVGTGWFFRCEVEWFLVTAAHVVEEFFPVGDRRKIKPPESMLLVPGDNEAMVPLVGKWSLSDVYDVAILRLESPSVVSVRWKPVTMADLAPEEPEGQYPWYHVTGWPTEYSKRVEGGLAGDKFRFNAQAEPVPVGDEFDRKREFASRSTGTILAQLMGMKPLIRSCAESAGLLCGEFLMTTTSIARYLLECRCHTGTATLFGTLM
ncbi:hypothetical protein [Corallococcus sp. 4LFB]|uniref:hypothetical protein n=1 Tax=Corallococcus sp. 4LFB TaxID=3383249 RepID=UPI003975440C